eukprot:TRINITY_DN3522_c0_g2_i2.p1 TRINITY_DN3522_c0_g2~~TRINITY_DN3522_c0_g2_i2.p1  ORF type:complete len:1874 (-),score=436.87 TRINITY_DN3522_c0_g2_i2:63-5684(-)
MSSMNQAKKREPLTTRIKPAFISSSYGRDFPKTSTVSSSSVLKGKKREPDKASASKRETNALNDNDNNQSTDMGRVITESWGMENNEVDLFKVDANPDFFMPKKQVELLEKTSNELNNITARVTQTLMQYETFNNQDDVFQLLDDDDDVQFTAGFDRKSIMEESKGKVKILIVDHNKLGVKRENILSSLREWFDEVKNDIVTETVHPEDERLGEEGQELINNIFTSAHNNKDKLSDLHSDLIEFFQQNSTAIPSGPLSLEDTSFLQPMVENLSKDLEDAMMKLADVESKSLSLEKILERKEEELKFFRGSDNSKSSNLREELFSLQLHSQEREMELLKEIQKLGKQLEKTRKQLDSTIAEMKPNPNDPSEYDLTNVNDTEELKVMVRKCESNRKMVEFQLKVTKMELEGEKASKENEIASLRAQKEEEFSNRAAKARQESRDYLEKARKEYETQSHQIQSLQEDKLARFISTVENALSEKDTRKVVEMIRSNYDDRLNTIKNNFNTEITKTNESYVEKESILRQDFQSKLEFIKLNHESEKRKLAIENELMSSKHDTTLKFSVESKLAAEQLAATQSMISIKKNIGNELKSLQETMAIKDLQLKEMLSKIDMLNEIMQKEHLKTEVPPTTKVKVERRVGTKEELDLDRLKADFHQEKKKAVELAQYKIRMEKDAVVNALTTKYEMEKESIIKLERARFEEEKKSIRSQEAKSLLQESETKAKFLRDEIEILKERLEKERDRSERDVEMGSEMMAQRQYFESIIQDLRQKYTHELQHRLEQETIQYQQMSFNANNPTSKPNSPPLHYDRQKSETRPQSNHSNSNAASSTSVRDPKILVERQFSASHLRSHDVQTDSVLHIRPHSPINSIDERSPQQTVPIIDTDSAPTNRSRPPTPNLKALTPIGSPQNYSPGRTSVHVTKTDDSPNFVHSIRENGLPEDDNTSIFNNEEDTTFTKPPPLTRKHSERTVLALVEANQKNQKALKELAENNIKSRRQLEAEKETLERRNNLLILELEKSKKYSKSGEDSTMKIEFDTKSELLEAVLTERNELKAKLLLSEENSENLKLVMASVDSKRFELETLVKELEWKTNKELKSFEEESSDATEGLRRIEEAIEKERHRLNERIKECENKLGTEIAQANQLLEHSRSQAEKERISQQEQHDQFIKGMMVNYEKRIKGLTEALTTCLNDGDVLDELKRDNEQSLQQAKLMNEREIARIRENMKRLEEEHANSLNSIHTSDRNELKRMYDTIDRLKAEFSVLLEEERLWLEEGENQHAELLEKIRREFNLSANLDEREIEDAEESEFKELIDEGITAVSSLYNAMSTVLKNRRHISNAVIKEKVSTVNVLQEEMIKKTRALIESKDRIIDQEKALSKMRSEVSVNQFNKEVSLAELRAKLTDQIQLTIAYKDKYLELENIMANNPSSSSRDFMAIDQYKKQISDLTSEILLLQKHIQALKKQLASNHETEKQPIDIKDFSTLTGQLKKSPIRLSSPLERQKDYYSTNNNNNRKEIYDPLRKGTGSDFLFIQEISDKPLPAPILSPKASTQQQQKQKQMMRQLSIRESAQNLGMEVLATAFTQQNRTKFVEKAWQAVMQTKPKDEEDMLRRQRANDLLKHDKKLRQAKAGATFATLKEKMRLRTTQKQLARTVDDKLARALRRIEENNKKSISKWEKKRKNLIQEREDHWMLVLQTIMSIAEFQRYSASIPAMYSVNNDGNGIVVKSVPSKTDAYTRPILARMEPVIQPKKQKPPSWLHSINFKEYTPFQSDGTVSEAQRVLHKGLHVSKEWSKLKSALEKQVETAFDIILTGFAMEGKSVKINQQDENKLERPVSGSGPTKENITIKTPLKDQRTNPGSGDHLKLPRISSAQIL